MAINIITGVPGAGKTYYGVYHLRKTFCVKTGNGYVLKQGYTLITNIDSLLIPHLSFDDLLEKTGRTFDQFFTVPYQEKITEKYPKLIYLIDESQRYFSRKTSKDTFYYFQYHRHLGHTVYLFTQGMNLLPKDITALAEFEVRAIRRSLSIMGEMRYLFYANREIVDRKTLKKDKTIFNLYKSMSAMETEKIKNPFLKYFIILGVVALILGYVFKRTFLQSSAEASAAVVRQQSGSTFDNIDQNTKKSLIPSQSKQKSNLSQTNFAIPYACSYYVLDDTYYILEPISARFLPSKSFPFPVSISRNSTGSVSVIASIPSQLLSPPE